MVGTCILPKTYVGEITKPLIFLGGPIRGAAHRHNEAIEILLAKNPNILIASPRRKNEISDFVKTQLITGDDTYFTRQRTWENHYLEIAAKTGGIVFWLPGETEHACEKAYGAMTRVELGEWMVHYFYNNDINFSIGSDGKFSELDTILVDLKKYAPGKNVYTTLEETCTALLQSLKNS